MKKLIVLLVMFVSSLSVFSQTFDNNCSVERFPMVYAYAQYQGAGLEIGLWAQDAKFGYFMGIGAVNETIYTRKSYEHNLEKSKILQTNVYFKTHYRLNRFFYATGSVGLISHDKPYVSAGLQISIPIGTGSNCAFIMEPQYGNRGANVKAGLGIAL